MAPLKHLLPLSLLLLMPACGTLSPWTTPEEADAIAVQRVDELEVAVEAVIELPIERTAAALPPRPSSDWTEIIVLVLTALGGTGGAVALRAMDHRKKRLEAQKGQAS